MTRDPRACDHERRGEGPRGGERGEEGRKLELTRDDRMEGGREEGRKGK